MSCRRLIVISSIALTALVGGACGSSQPSGRSSTPTTTPKRLRLASTGTAAAPVADAGPAMYPVRPTRYVLDTKLADLGTRAPVLRMDPHPVTEADVQRFAAALGVAGAPVHNPVGWELQTADATLSVATSDGGAMVSYARGAPGSVDGSTGSGSSGSGVVTPGSAVANGPTDAIPPKPAPEPVTGHERPAASAASAAGRRAERNRCAGHRASVARPHGRALRAAMVDRRERQWRRRSRLCGRTPVPDPSARGERAHRHLLARSRRRARRRRSVVGHDRRAPARRVGVRRVGFSRRRRLLSAAFDRGRVRRRAERHRPVSGRSSDGGRGRRRGDRHARDRPDADRTAVGHAAGDHSGRRGAHHGGFPRRRALERDRRARQRRRSRARLQRSTRVSTAARRTTSSCSHSSRAR